MKRCVVIRHVEYEGLSGYRGPIEAAGYRIDRLPACRTDFVAADFVTPELLVVMGGPMGVYEQEAHPWIADEVAAIARRIASGRPTLGVCLGAQMIAAALGERVYRGPEPEIGFAPIVLNRAGRGSSLARLGEVAMLHWHGDTFDLPPDVELLASTGRYAHQAFRRGPNLLALQFHAEMGTDPRFETWLDGVADPARRAALRADHDRLGPKAVAAGQAMMIDWLGRLER